MCKQISNKEEFAQNLHKLGELYEEGKKLATALLPAPASKKDMEYWDRLQAVLQQMRDLTAVQMQHKHWLNEN
jgi:hypothetical protein